MYTVLVPSAPDGIGMHKRIPVCVMLEGTTQKINFFSVVLFDTKLPLQDEKFYADFQEMIHLKKY